MSKLFVANFSFSVDDAQLREFFSAIGEVKDARVITDNESGRSRGFGFVEMGSPELAKKAIEELNGKEWEGRELKVNEDRKKGGDHGGRDSSHAGGRSSGGFRGQRDDRSKQQQGFFKAQPFNADFRRRKKVDPFVEDENLNIDYKDARLLKRFISERGKVLPRRMTGLNAHNQRAIARAVKRAQHLALLPITGAGA